MSMQLNTSRPIKMLPVVSFDWNRVSLFVVIVGVACNPCVIFDRVALKKDEGIGVARIRMIPEKNLRRRIVDCCWTKSR